MSLKTWMKQFYSTPAESNTKTDLQAAKHCLRKWRGLTKKNVDKHKVLRDDWHQTLYDKGTDPEIGGFGAVGTNTCALCKKYYEQTSHCEACPLTKHSGECGWSPFDAYNVYIDTGDPKRMIRKLERCVARLEKAKKGTK